MKSQEQTKAGAKTGVSRLWLGVAAAAGAAIAYLGDKERGNARRQAALRQLSGAAQAAADRTKGWRKLVSARLPGQAHDQPPAQVTVPIDPEVVAKPRSRPKTVEQPAQAVAETNKPNP